MPIYFILTLAFLNGTSEQAARVMLALYALELGAQPLTIGMLAATFSLFPMLLAVLTGKLADRFDVRWLLMFGSGATGVSMLLPYFVPGLPAIFAAAAMIGLADAIYSVSVQNLVGLLSATHERARNFNNYSLAASAFCFVGPLFAGFSIDLSGHAMACIYLAVLTLVPAIMLAIWGKLIPATTGQVAATGGGFRALILESGVGRVVITSSLLSCGNYLYQFYLPVYATTIGLSASVIGMVLAMSAAAMFVMRLILPRLITKYSAESLLTYAFLAGAASLILVPLLRDAIALGLISFIFGLSVGCGHPLVLMLMFGNAPIGRSGEALGLRMTVNHLAKIIFPVIFGSIASAFGLPPTFWLNALMLGTAGMLSRPRRPK